MGLEKLISSQLREMADKLDAGHSTIDEDILLKSLDLLSEGDKTQLLSKELACRYMNMSRSSFDSYVRMGFIPEGRKQVGLKELTWNKLQLDAARARIQQGKPCIL